MLRESETAFFPRLAFLTGGLVCLLLVACLFWTGFTAPLFSRLPVPSPDGKYFAYFNLVEEGPSEEENIYDLIVSTARGRLMARFPMHAGPLLWSNAGHLAVVDEKHTIVTLIANVEDRLLILARIVLSSGMEPSWSRDGNKLAVVRPAPAGDQVAIYDIQQPQAFRVPLPAEFQLLNPRLLFWSPGSGYLFFLNEEGQDVVLVKVEVQTGRVQTLARGIASRNAAALGLPQMSPDGTKIYLPPPRSCVIDSQTGGILWALPRGVSVLWSAWSNEGHQLFYFRTSDPSRILGHDFSGPSDQVIVSGVQPNGIFAGDGRNYFFRSSRQVSPSGLVASVRVWLEKSWGWQQVDTSTASIHPLGRMEFWPGEQNMEGSLLARRDDYTKVRFGLYHPEGRLFDEYAFPTTREDVLRQVRYHRLVLVTIALYAFMALWVYLKRPGSAAAHAFYVLLLALMLLFVSRSLFSTVTSVKPHLPLRVTPGEIERLGSWTTSSLSQLAIEGAGFVASFLWALLPAALLNLAVVFPEVNHLFLGKRALKLALYGVGFLPLLGVLTVPGTADPMQSPGRILLLLAGATAISVWLLTLAFNFRRPPERRSRDQIRWLTMATGMVAAGALALLAAHLLSGIFAGEEPRSILKILRGTALVLMAWVAPLAAGYALAAQKPYRLGLLVRRIARQVLISLVVLLVFLASLIWVSWLMTGSFLAPSVLVFAVAVMLAILVILPFRGRLRGFVDRMLDRAGHESREKLLDFARGLPHIVDRQTLVARLDETLPKAMGARWQSLFTLDRSARRLRLQSDKVSLPGGAAGVEFDPDEPLCQYVLDKERPFEAEVAPYSAELFPVFRTAAGRLDPLEAAVVLGLKRRHELLGLLVMGSKTSGEFYDAEELELLMAMAREAAVAVENIDLFGEVARDREHQKELEDASEVQARLLPTVVPRLSSGQVAGHCFPARSACGDFYDFLVLPGQRTGITIGDVSGRGMSASLLMASVQGLLRTLAPAAGTMEDLVRRVNRELHGSSAGAKFCALFFGIYDDARRRLEFVNAGHSPPVVVTANGARFLESTGLPLGLFPEITHTPRTEVLDPGTLLVLYSDGVTETRNTRGDSYGMDRLLDAVARARGEDADQLMARILADIRDFEAGAPLQDDQTLVVLKLNTA